MKTIPLVIFSILSFLGVLSYTVPLDKNTSPKHLDPVSTFIKPPTPSAIQFNSTWNKSNEYKWVPIKGVRYMEVDIDKYPQYRTKYHLRSLPTIIVFNNGKEVHRYEADLMMKLNITQHELQINIK
jgi:hypothetical protein